MVDSRFYRNAGPFSLARIVAELGQEPLEEGGERLICDVASIDRAREDEISFLTRSPQGGEEKRIRAGAVLVTQKDRFFLPPTTVALIVESPRLAYARLAALFYPETVMAKGEISPSAVIDPAAQLAEAVCVGPQAVIGANAMIGAGSVIGAGAVIGDGVVLGLGCRIGPGCVISHTLAGDRLTTFAGARIGQSGFGFAATKSGFARIPHLGRVIIGQDVRVGANSTIDRGTIEDTTIGDGAIIDNLVQIGHNVQIGKGCILAGQVGLSGSVRLGDHVVLGGQVGIADHVEVGSGARVAARSAVLRNIPAGEQWGGYPALPLWQWHRQTVGLARMMRKKGE